MGTTTIEEKISRRDGSSFGSAQDDKLSKGQLICIKTLMGKLAVEDGDAMVRGFTGLRTGKVSEMLPKEAGELIKHLKGLDPEEAKADVMRKKLIALAYKRAALPQHATREQKQAVVNWLDAWCKKYGHKHKALNSYTYAELPKLVTQAEIMFDKLLIEI